MTLPEISVLICKFITLCKSIICILNSTVDFGVNESTCTVWMWWMNEYRIWIRWPHNAFKIDPSFASLWRKFRKQSTSVAVERVLLIIYVFTYVLIVKTMNFSEDWDLCILSLSTNFELDWRINNGIMLSDRKKMTETDTLPT